MKTLQSLDKLREHVKRENLGGINDRAAFYREGMELVDEIEAEIAERFVVLPVDADGITISVGDVVQGLGNSGPVQHLELWDGRWVVVFEYEPGQFTRYSGDGVHHVKPRTLEDMLADFAYKVCDTNVDDSEIERYADEIRAMFGEVDR